MNANPLTRLDTLEVLHDQAQQAVRKAEVLLAQAEDRERKLRRELDSARQRATRREAPVSNALKESVWRSAVRELASFTADELAAELGVKKSTARHKLKEYEQKGIVAIDGHLGRTPTFVFVKPDSAGEDYERQQETKGRLTVVPDVKTAEPVAGTGRTLIKAIPAQVRDIAREAINHGWSLEPMGNGHFKLVKGAVKITIASTPRDADNLAKQIKRSIAAAERPR